MGRQYDADGSSGALGRGETGTPKKIKLKRTRRGGEKHNYNRKETFTLLGNNVAGINSKKSSLEAVM